MRVIALVSLAFALAAFSMPLSARSNDVPVTGQQITGSLGSAGSGIGKATPNPSGSLGSIPKGGSGGTVGSGSGTPSLGSGTLGSRSKDIVNSAGGTNVLGTGAKSSSQVGETEPTVGKASSVTSPSTHNTRLRSRAAPAGSASGAGTVVSELTGAAGGAGKIGQGNVTPSGAGSAASGAGSGVNGLGQPGSSPQTGSVPV